MNGKDVKFKQKIIDNKFREVTIILPIEDSYAKVLQDIDAIGNDAQQHIIKYVFGLTAGLCTAFGISEIENILYSVYQCVCSETKNLFTN